MSTGKTSVWLRYVTEISVATTAMLLGTKPESVELGWLVFFLFGIIHLSHRTQNPERES